MSEFVADCLWCGCKKMTFEYVGEHAKIDLFDDVENVQFFGTCRNCEAGSVLTCKPKRQMNRYEHQERWAEDQGYSRSVFTDLVQLRPPAVNQIPCPEHVPEPIRSAFDEGAKCLTEDCYNATGAMFRLCLDLTTKDKLPQTPADDGGPNKYVRGNLAARINWLCEEEHLNPKLKRFAEKIKLDGNDGAHVGNLKKIDAEDLATFTKHLLENIYTLPESLELSFERRSSEKETS
ncbi:protein of unknown function [Pseudovibrio denitrificans]|uniref:DUF4145 domain-containing protein n=1 Tax=Pseudovibrio denitrificans TaxID=258256 RepID=A0A1I6Y0Q8_9HYPH|nr:DUF4145 domain-containing protein [Pseudovibrio denitrificans]SFT43724.1 protein of unknown function [Pseudovibrio denitrificans]